MLPQLVHKHLIPYHQIRITKFAAGAMIEILMERCSGDLASLLKQAQESEALQYDDVERYCVEIATGVDFLHRRGIIHGDLKPGNILVRGLAAGGKTLLVGDLDDLIQMQESTTCSKDILQLRGTVRYMSPEMLKKFGQVEAVNPGRKTDIWSLGCIMLEIAECCLESKTNKKRLEKNGEAVSVTNVPNSRFTLLILDGYVPFVQAEVPRKLAACIRLCLQHNPRERISAEGLLHTFSVGDVNKSEKSIPIQTADADIVIIQCSNGVIGDGVKAVVFDPVTNQIRVLETPLPKNLLFVFPQLTLPNSGIIFKDELDGMGMSEHDLCLWNISDGTMSDFSLNEVPWPGSSRWFCPVVVNDTIYYMRCNQYDDCHFFVAEDIHSSSIILERSSPIKGFSVEAVAELDGKILYAHNSRDRELVELDLYDPMADQWTSLQPLPQRREMFGMAVVRGYIYILSGCVTSVFESAVMPSCIRLNIETSMWEDIQTLQRPRHSHSACVVNERIYVCGGKNNGNADEYSIEMYDTTDNGFWSTVALSAQDERLLRRTVGGFAIRGVAVAK
ncbi:uncharacterized protein LOC129598572 isoform X2 [Paramacrobiotus metropolitanus]|nr:uncharacterized protein LOC129598572 isoform X2 [Paramacrobiotus metropolitanus]